MSVLEVDGEVGGWVAGGEVTGGEDAGGEETGGVETGVGEVPTGAGFFDFRDLLATVDTLILFPTVLRFPAASLTARAFTIAITAPGLRTPTTVTLKVLLSPEPATFTFADFVMPESPISAAEKPWTGSLKETVKRTADCEVGLGWPAARLIVGFGRVQS